jgi:glycosyltransferase involved in cell wall biosynthesis
MLSVVIPAHNEAGSIADVVGTTSEVLDRAQIEHEILVVDVGSTDGTAAAVQRLAEDNERVRCYRSHSAAGSGSPCGSGWSDSRATRSRS